MGIQDILGNMGKQSSASSRMSGGLPAYSKRDADNAKLISKELSTIDNLVKSSTKNWEKMGAAKALINVKKALEKVEKAEAEFNEAMHDTNASLEKRAALYEKLAKVKNKQIKIQNDEVKKAREAEGMLGRAKNVMADMAKNWKTLGLGVFFKGLSVGLSDAAANFDILAESSQISNVTFGELAKSSANYSVELNLASLKAAQFGVSTKESTIAFAKLSKVYGGTREAVNDLGAGWSDMVQIAKVSGIGMEAFTDLATQGMLRLGESMETTKQNAVDISQATATMNQRFGAGSANAKEFANAVTQLAFSQGSYNQNTKMVIDTLARETSHQLALGKSRSAAIAAAKENIELAGTANLVGVQKITEDLQRGYAAAKREGRGEEFLEENVGSGEEGKFGAESDVIRHMLENNRMSLFAMQEMAKNSSSMQQNILLAMKKAAADQDIGGLLKFGVKYPKAAAMIERAAFTNTQLATIASGDTDESNAMIKELFGKEAGSEATKEFVASARGGEYRSEGDMFEAYYKLINKATSDADDKRPGAANTWQDFVRDTKGKGWFRGATGLLSKISDTLSKLFAAAGAAGTVMGIGGAGAGIGALLSGAGGSIMAAAGTGLAAAGTALAAIISGAGALMTAIAVVAAPVLAAIAIADMVHNAFTSDSISEWAGKTMDHIFGSLLDFSPDDLKKLGMGSLETPLTAFADTLVDVLDWTKDISLASIKRAIFGDNRTNQEKLEESFEGRHAASQKQGGKLSKMNLAGYTQSMILKNKLKWGTSVEETKKRMLEERGLSNGKPEEAATVVEEGGPVDEAGTTGGRSLRATGSVSGGSLILEVSNWDSIYAQSVLGAV